VDTAIRHLSENDFENALIQLSIALDRTARKKHPKLGVGKRIMKFAKEYESFIYQFASGGSLVPENGALISFKIDEKNVIWSEILYKSIRCALLHGDEIEDTLEFTMDLRIGFNGKKILINQGHISGLLYSIVSDEVNKNELCKVNSMVGIGNQGVEINKLWGNLRLIEKFSGFKKKPQLPTL
jgi:hypothetical protein